MRIEVALSARQKIGWVLFEVSSARECHDIHGKKIISIPYPCNRNSYSSESEQLITLCEVPVTDLINLMNDLLWGSILVYLLVGVGIYFTLRLGFIQFRHFTHTFTVLKNSRKADNAGISSFQALCTSLAARVGTGNMAGVA
ncbi:alanine:cation symporter family protein, partial [Vibrio cholerae]